MLTVVPVDLFYPSPSYISTIYKLATYLTESASDFLALFAGLAKVVVTKL
jgi:hypothetical protein